MLALDLIESFLPQYKNNKYLQREWFLTYQTIYAMCVLSYCIYGLTNYYFYRNIEIIKSIIWVIKEYVILDMYICSTFDIYLHHVIAFTLTYISLKNEILFVLIENFYIVVLMTEISTFFLTVRIILFPHKHKKWINIVNNINNVLFVSTFYYTRWGLYYKYGISNNDNFIAIKNNVSIYEYYISYFCIYMLFFINIYWGILIGKMILKPFFKEDKIKLYNR